MKGFIDEYSDVVSGANFKGLYPKVTDGDVLNAVKKLPCDFIATCADNEGSYTCSCPDGFTIDTNSINECAGKQLNCKCSQIWAHGITIQNK